MARVSNRGDTGFARNQSPEFSRPITPPASRLNQRLSNAPRVDVRRTTNRGTLDTLRLSGLVLVVSSVISYFNCYAIYAENGQTHYLDMEAVSAFMTLFMGMMAMQTRQWLCFPSNVTVSGFLFLSTLKLMQTIIVGLMMLHYDPNQITPQDNMWAAFVCALSFLNLVLASLGLSVASCCWSPPPTIGGIPVVL